MNGCSGQKAPQMRNINETIKEAKILIGEFFDEIMDITNRSSSEHGVFSELEDNFKLNRLNLQNANEKLMVQLFLHFQEIYEAMRSVSTILDAIKMLEDPKSIIIMLYHSNENIAYVLDLYNEKIIGYSKSIKNTIVDSKDKYDQTISKIMTFFLKLLEVMEKYGEKFKTILNISC
jgi:hypothetical protein